MSAEGFNGDLNKLLGKLDADMEHLQGEVAKINGKLDASYVTRVEFAAKIEAIDATITPMRLLLYGLVGTVLTTVLGAVLALVIMGAK